LPCPCNCGIRGRDERSPGGPFRKTRHGQAEGAGVGAGADRAQLRQGLDHAPGLDARPRHRGDLDRLDRARHSTRHRRPAQGAGHRDLRPRELGKTTLALHVIAEEQKSGGVCAFVDAEHALDPVYAKKLGVNIDDLLVSQPDTGEQALEITETLVRSGAVSVVVVDSVAALTPKSELEGEMGDAQVGAQARLMSQAMRKLTSAISRSQCMVIFINQIRMKIGVMFGSPETTSGGNALKFYASVRLDIRRIGAIKDRDEVVGNTTRVKVVKNKVAPPFKQVEFDIMYGEGISKRGELIDLGVKAGVVEKSGAWYSFADQRIGQGRENAKAFLKDNADIAWAIEDKIRAAHGLDFAMSGDEKDELLDE
jgi:recombination protein RecA